MPARILERDLGRRVFDLLDDQQVARQAQLAALRIDLGANFGLRAVARFRGLRDRVFHGGDHDAAVDRFFARDRVGDLKQFELIGADGHRQSPSWEAEVLAGPIFAAE